MDMKDRIKSQLGEFPILLYMKGTPDFPQCGFSAKVCGILKASNKRFAFVNILEDHEIREGLKTYSNWPTFPQLYVNGELVGGSDIVEQMFNNGELDNVLDSVKYPE
ncbi:MAG TPA: Grx4 family monothiol glutaredoxin [Gammaproteobacteria bacterium]|jgi:monothiol glutaredoxin|nr:Grx4 family monothiol glutaredoxin [Gammaproteobacteria bacterium]HIK76424.1 Grx4 family monothiol glutaredoxin [Gammaproteobacteria bacterium]|tara:strand:- start:4362 stop:4682 length:321 start_codon:yes stop_codon:yes gene_type:complete